MIDEQTARAARQYCLDAFDVYKVNVDYGIEMETSPERDAIVAWYRKILDLPLDKDVYTADVPPKVKKYIKKLV